MMCSYTSLKNLKDSDDLGKLKILFESLILALSYKAAKLGLHRGR